MSATPPARRRDAVAKKAAIEAAAVDLVLESGYDAVTVDMICARAGVSPRTFFNHFKTKDAALLGTDGPTVDERAAREFIVSTGPLLVEAVQLIRIDPGLAEADPALVARRIRAVGTNPVLMARQMERLSTIEADLGQIITLRLRQQYPAEDETALGAQAVVITHMLAGVMRFIGQSWAAQVERGELPVLDPPRIREQLTAAIGKLA